jgi:hypothetical protein
MSLALAVVFCYDTSDLGVRCFYLEQRRWDVSLFSIFYGEIQSI